MYICQWHLDIKFGKLGEALEIMRKWGAEKFKSSEFKRAKGAKMMVGYLGESPSHVCDEYYFESVSDFEAAIASVGQPQFKQYSDAIAPLIVDGSQIWKVYREV